MTLDRSPGLPRHSCFSPTTLLVINYLHDCAVMLTSPKGRKVTRYTNKMSNHSLAAGDMAPDFTVQDVKGKTITLSKYRDQSVLLVFLRYAGCPWCNLAIHRLALEYPMLHKQNCQIIAFVQSDSESICENIYERHEVTPQFPIIADPDKEFYKLYGVHSRPAAITKAIRAIPYWVHAVKAHGFKQTKMDGDLFMVPATFLISSKTGQIVEADYDGSF